MAETCESTGKKRTTPSIEKAGDAIVDIHRCKCGCSSRGTTGRGGVGRARAGGPTSEPVGVPGPMVEDKEATDRAELVDAAIDCARSRFCVLAWLELALPAGSVGTLIGVSRRTGADLMIRGATVVAVTVIATISAIAIAATTAVA